MDPARRTVRAILTVPNLISLARIGTTPVFAVLIVDPDTTALGLGLFAAVAATDWLDGYLARRLAQVSRIGELLDPTADRLAIAAGLIALSLRGAFPWWAALPVLLRDGVVLLAGAFALARHRVRIEVRWIGKLATLNLMVGVTSVSWGTLGYALGEIVGVVGWAAFALGLATSYVAAVQYLGDLRRALADA